MEKPVCVFEGFEVRFSTSLESLVRVTANEDTIVSKDHPPTRLVVVVCMR